MENPNPLSPPSSLPLPPPPPPPEEEGPDSKKLKMSTTTATTSDDEDRSTNAANTEKKPRYKRRKVAILFAYCGVGYQGMQKNPGAKTIEGDLEEALFFSGAVPEQDRGCPKRFDFARSARTDKGVSAVGQVVSGRFYVDPPGFIERLNNNLPPQFRIFGYKRVTASFNAKKFCDRRRYVYLLPVFALDPTSHRDRESVLASVGSENELSKCLECSERGRKLETTSGISSNTSNALPLSDGKQESLSSLDNGSDCINRLNPEDNSSALRTDCNNNPSSDAVNGAVNGENGNTVKENVFTYGEKEKERFNKILKQYEGTHNFHNFTTRTKAGDPSAHRYIISFHANTTVTVDGIEFVKCEVVGQSFMLHQIRKMIGVAVAIMRDCAPESLMETAFQQDVRITVPTAPEVGLYLDECFFSSYNKKWKDTHEEVSMKDYAEEAEEFKLKHIYSHIASTEHKEGAVAVWLHSLNYRNYPDLEPLENGAPTAQPEETTQCNSNILHNPNSHSQKSNLSKKPDPMLELIASGRVSIGPTRYREKTTVVEIDLDHLATTIKHRLNQIFPFIEKLRNHYPGSDTSVTDSITTGINMMVDTAISVTYNRLRKVLQHYDSNAFVSRMNPRSPFSNRFKFPAFLSSILGSIGPLHITDGPQDICLVYATSAARCRTYGRAEQFEFVSGHYDRLVASLEAIGVPVAPIDVKAANRGGSFFSTVVPTRENGRWSFIAPFHYSHYEPKDIVSAWLTQNDDPALRAFEDCSLTIGCCTDPAVVDAVADVDRAAGPTRMVGGAFPVNVSGIGPAVEGNPVVPGGVYIVGRGSERYYCTSLARDICEWELVSLLKEDNSDILVHPDSQKTNPSKRPDPMLDLIASGRVRIWPLRFHGKTTIVEVNLDNLATTIKNRLNLVFPYLLDLLKRYRGPETDITDGINAMVDTAIAVTYNRLREVLQRYDPTAFAARMNPRSPHSNRFKFPAFLSSILGSIGPLRITDGPGDICIVYATSAATCRNYGRSEQFDFNGSRYYYLIESLEAIGVPCAPIDVKLTDRGGSFFSTVIPTREDGVWGFTAPFHHSHYEPKDIVSAWLTQNDDPALRAFEDCSLTIGCCTDPAVVDAVADVDGTVGPTRLVGGSFPVNVSGIRPVVAGEGGNPAVPAGVYIVGRGSERYYCTSLARNIYDSEMFKLLSEYIFAPPKGDTSF